MSTAIIAGVIVILVIASVVLAAMTMKSKSPAPAPAPEDIAPEDIGRNEATAMGLEDSGGDQADFVPEDESTTTGVTLTNEDPDASPDTIEGLVAWYDADSYEMDGPKWADKSGKGNDITEFRGNPEKVEGDGDFNFNYVFGYQEDGFRIPTSAITTGKKFTFFHIARYMSDDNAKQARIFDGTDTNWLSGFHAGHTGMAHRESCYTMAHWDGTQKYKHQWLQHTDQKTLLRRNGIQRSGLTNGACGTPTQVSVNYGQAYAGGWGGTGETSEWGIAEMVIYDRELTTEEIVKVENWLMKKYGILKEYWKPTWQGAQLWSTDTSITASSGAHANGDLSFLANRGMTCGPQGAMYFHRWHSHWYRATDEEDQEVPDEERTHIWRRNGNYQMEHACLQGLPIVEPEIKSTASIKIDDDTGDWVNRLKKWKMDCGNKALAGYEIKKVGNKLKIDYQCGRQLNTEGCYDLNDYQHPRPSGVHTPDSVDLGNGQKRPAALSVTAGMDLNQLGCRTHTQALTKLDFVYDEENDNFHTKGRCCPIMEE